MRHTSTSLASVADRLEEIARIARGASTVVDDEGARQDLTIILAGPLMSALHVPKEDALRLANQQSAGVIDWLGSVATSATKEAPDAA